MKKNRLFMVGFVGIMMAAALLLSGCKEEDKENTDPKKITITGLPDAAKGQPVLIILSSEKAYSENTEAAVVAVGEGTVSEDGSLTVDLYKFAEGVITTNGKINADAEKWTGTGSYYVILGGGVVSTSKIEIKDTTTTRAYNTTDFEEIESEASEE